MKKILLYAIVFLLAGTGASAQEKASKKQVASPKASKVTKADAAKAARIAEKKQIELQNQKAPAAAKPAEASLVDPRSL